MKRSLNFIWLGLSGSLALGDGVSWRGNLPDTLPTIVLTAPLDGGHVAAGADVAVAAQLADPGGFVRSVEFHVNGRKAFEAPPWSPQFTLGDVPLGAQVLQAIAWNFDGTSVTSGPVAIFAELESGLVPLVPNGALWSYLADGTAPDFLWLWPGFDELGWNHGLAELGYGDAANDQRPETTVVSYGPDPANKYVTTYFRHEFFEGDPTRYTTLGLRVLRDDGAVVYLNGLEVWRSNLDPGPVNQTTLASGPAADDGATYWETNLSPTILVPGFNVVAVEVHQDTPHSPDLSFDCMLLGQLPAPPGFLVQPGSQVSPYFATVQFFAAATDNPNYQWYRNGNLIPGANAPVLVLPNVQRSDVGIYHVVASNPGGTTPSRSAELQVNMTTHGAVLQGVIATDNAVDLSAFEGGGAKVRQFGKSLPSLPVYLSHGVPLFFPLQNGTADAGLVMCGVTSTNTKWVGYYSPVAEHLRLSTEGSDFDTVLGVYTNYLGALVPVGCDRGTAGQPYGVVEFDATPRLYYIAVDGENGEARTVRLQIRSQFLQYPEVNGAADTFTFELVARPGRTYILRGTNTVDASLAPWPLLLQFTTNMDWVLLYSVPGVTSRPRYLISGQQQ